MWGWPSKGRTFLVLGPPVPSDWDILGLRWDMRLGLHSRKGPFWLRFENVTKAPMGLVTLLLVGRGTALRSPCLACSVEGAACLCHVMACAVAMEITQSACSLSGKFLCSVELRRSRVSSLGSPCMACSVEGAACLCHAMACAVAMEITQSACLTFWEVSLLRRTSTEQGRRPKKPMSSLFCLCHAMACAVAMEITKSACLTFGEVSLLR